jgi:hypothetical protein
MVVPAGGQRVSTAMPNALVTSAAVGEESTDQPITRREDPSTTTAQWTFPSLPGLVSSGSRNGLRRAH